MKKNSDMNWKGFLNLCLDAKNPKLLKEFFELFLTPEEEEMLKARFAIIQALLNKELPQRDLGKKYQVSIAQITRGSNALKYISSELELFLTKHLKKKEKIS